MTAFLFSPIAAILILAGGLSAPAHAFDFEFLNPVGIPTARSAVRAKIRDWQDDEEHIAGRRKAACGLAWAKGYSPVPVIGPLPLQLMNHLPAVTVRGALRDDRPVDLERLLQRLDSAGVLTDSERKGAALLGARPIWDDVERWELLVDSHWFLMRVANRMLMEWSDGHWEKAKKEGFEEHTCQSLYLRGLRNTQLTAAGLRLLTYLDQLEKELEK